MHRVLEPEAFVNFLRQFNELSKHSFYEGYVLDKKMGITCPPYPPGLKPGAILSTFFHLPDCVENEADKILLQQRSKELVSGFLFFMRDRWPNTIRHKLRIPKHGKVLGGWLRAAYALCLETAPYIPIEKGDNRLGVDGPAFFHQCSKDLAEGNGIISLLVTLYPPKEVDESNIAPERLKEAIKEAGKQARAADRSTVNREDCTQYLKSIVTRIKNHEQPIPLHGRIGYFGTLLHYATAAAENDNELKNGVLKDFCAQTRDYIEMVGSKQYAIAKRKNDGSVFLSSGKRGPEKKLALESQATHTFQELNIFLDRGPKAMQ